MSTSSTKTLGRLFGGENADAPFCPQHILLIWSAMSGKWRINSVFLQCLLPFSSQKMFDLPPSFFLLLQLPERNGASVLQYHPEGCWLYKAGCPTGCVGGDQPVSHRMSWVGRDPKAQPIPTPCCGQCHPAAQAAQGPIEPGIECLQGRGTHSFYGQLCQSFTTLSGKNFPLTSNLNLPSFI